MNCVSVSLAFSQGVILPLCVIAVLGVVVTVFEKYCRHASFVAAFTTMFVVTLEWRKVISIPHIPPSPLQFPFFPLLGNVYICLTKQLAKQKKLMYEISRCSLYSVITFRLCMCITCKILFTRRCKWCITGENIPGMRIGWTSNLGLIPELICLTNAFNKNPAERIDNSYLLKNALFFVGNTKSCWWWGSPPSRLNPVFCQQRTTSKHQSQKRSQPAAGVCFSWT